MGQTISAATSSNSGMVEDAAPIDPPHSFRRGLAFGLILALPLWIAIGYVIFILR